MKFDLKELKKITILYVEDEEMIRSQTVSMFDNLFKKTHVAKDGLEGLNLFKIHSNEIDAVVSDINMPELSGLEMSEEIHAITNEVPIILTTAYTDEEFLLKSLELNIFKYVTKPLKFKELTFNILEGVKKYHHEKNLKNKAKFLINQQILAKKEVSKLHEDMNLNQREIKIQEDIINDYVSFLKLDNNGIIMNASNKFCIVYGYKKSEIFDKHINHLCENKSLIQKKLLEAIREKKVIDFTDVFITKGQKKLNLYCELYPLYENSDGLVTGYNLYQDTFIP